MDCSSCPAQRVRKRIIRILSTRLTDSVKVLNASWVSSSSKRRHPPWLPRLLWAADKWWKTTGTQSPWLVEVLIPNGIRFLDDLLFWESRMLPAYDKYFRDAELFIYYIPGFIRKEIGSFKIITLIGLNSRDSTLPSLFTDSGPSSKSTMADYGCTCWPADK